ncbi:MAG: hypothetical protein KDC85_11610 [Saprospiraceae bacterium]|nr:hypothetical protein [Saprospiraceae bacterium]MCB9325807.1 hypothetical protein [Lewinellaceae bacterium]
MGGKIKNQNSLNFLMVTVIGRLDTFPERDIEIFFSPSGEAGIVELPEHYLYSSARNYVGQQGLIEVEILDFRNNIGYIDL